MPLDWVVQHTATALKTGGQKLVELFIGRAYQGGGVENQGGAKRKEENPGEERSAWSMV